eukprot:Rmarinus@m.21614
MCRTAHTPSTWSCAPFTTTPLLEPSWQRMHVRSHVVWTKGCELIVVILVLTRGSAIGQGVAGARRIKMASLGASIQALATASVALPQRMRTGYSFSTPTLWTSWQKKDSMTFKAVGGIVDAYIMLGPTPDDVTRQYHTIIGTPAMMPRWALGFHQCRYGYDSLSEVEEVVSQYKKHDLPLDVMWVDIDYMDEYRTFTLDESRYPSSRFRSLADDLHAAGQRLVLIVDPGVKVDPGYGTYDRGIEQGIFIRNTDLDPLVAKMWPGLVVHPDFTHPGADAFWEGEIRAFQEKVGFDGLWLDVNEITSFCDGRCVLKAEEEDGAYLFSCACNSQQWQDNPYDQPAYLPGVFTRMCRTDKVKGLDCGTLSMTARHYGNDGYGKHSLEYNYHNLYGTNEANATASALRQVTGERPFVLTRATFPGVGRVAAHWTGDNHSHHRDLITSLSEVMLFSLIGVPATGADVCGFHDDTTTELCARWMQAASLAYPFYRNHNNPTTIAQEPYALGEPLLSISRDTLRLRYSLVMYLYSEFHHVHKQGGALIRPLFLEYPTDTTTFGIDQQFLVGTRGLLVSPALAQGQRRVDAYFPVGSTWFDFFTGDVAVSLSDDSRLLSLDVPLDKMPVHVRAGNIIPIQEPRRTTPELSASPISLLIAVEPTTFSPLLANPAAATAATGRIMWDDGVSEDESTRLVIDLAASRTSSGMLVTGTVIRDGYKGQVPEISEVHVYGGSCSPLSIGPFPINKSFQIEYLC